MIKNNQNRKRNFFYLHILEPIHQEILVLHRDQIDRIELHAIVYVLNEEILLIKDEFLHCMYALDEIVIDGYVHRIYSIEKKTNCFRILNNVFSVKRNEAL